jgi:hypothetical protein
MKEQTILGKKQQYFSGKPNKPHCVPFVDQFIADVLRFKALFGLG